MTAPPRSPAPARPLVDRWTLARRWAVLVPGSALATLLLAAGHVSAAALLGPLLVAMVFAARDRAVPVSPVLMVFCQAIVGCMVARSIPLSIVGEIGKGWPVFIVSVTSVVAVAAGLGWLLARWGLLPGTTAVWGSFPGAATAMVVMSEAFGADVRLVALMQYLRVLLVGVAATTVARLWLPPHAAVAAQVLPAWPTLDVGALAATLALAGGGVAVARVARLPAGALLVPMFAGIALQGLGWMKIELPWPLLYACYAVVGWSIGLRFTRDILGHAARLLPRVVASIAVLIAICGGLAWLLARLAHVDALTAYLATSPGGADTVAIIASQSPVDVPFVMAMQSARFLVVAFLGPAMARFIARRV